MKDRKIDQTGARTFTRFDTTAPHWKGLRRVVKVKSRVTGKEGTILYREVPREYRKKLGEPIILETDLKELEADLN